MPSVFDAGPDFGIVLTTVPLMTKSILSPITRTSSALVHFPLASRFFAAAFNEPGPIVRHHEVQVVLPRTFQTAPTEDEAIVLVVTGRFDEREGALERVIPGDRIRWVPVDGRLRVDLVEARSHRHELDGARSV